MGGFEDQEARAQSWLKPVAIVALFFGGMTILSGGGVLFGPFNVREMAGDYLGFVVWFNFLAGFLYVMAGIGIWLNQRWAAGLSWFIAGATALVALVFAAQVMRGVAFEMRTVGALTLRVGLWAVIALALAGKGMKHE